MKRRPRIEIHESVNGEWFWHLQDGNNEIVAVGGEGYTRREDAKRAAKNARKTFLTSKIV